LPLFRAFGHYPLLLRALAGEVAEYKPVPGDFERWRHSHPQFNPAGLPLKNARTHVLDFALRGLGEAPRRVLHTLAAFRMPTTWDTLEALLVGEGKPCADARLAEHESFGEDDLLVFNLPVAQMLLWQGQGSKAAVLPPFDWGRSMTCIEHSRYDMTGSEGLRRWRWAT
jgi:hypothetical protein